MMLFMRYLLCLWCCLLCLTLPLAAQKKRSPKPPKHDQVVIVTTRLGEIHLLLYDDTPAHKANFLKLASEGFYDSTIFHRVLDRFMIQGGDPNSRNGQQEQIGMGGPGYTLPAEIRPHYTHKAGMLAAARQGDAINPERRSSGSQFYIVENEEGAKHLDGAYTIFGEVIKGMDIVHRIADEKVSREGRPQTPVHMRMQVQRLKRKKITALYLYQYPVYSQGFL